MGSWFQIVDSHFSYTMYGFIHIKGGRVEYRATIRDILPFSRNHYEDEALAERVKPEPWLREWRENTNNARSHPWNNALVMTDIVPFSYDTYSFQKYDGTTVRWPPHGYVRVFPPSHTMPGGQGLIPAGTRRTVVRSSLAERNVEDFVVQQLEEIEPGLHLEERQLSTPAGRLDLLCRDADGNYVVVELKRMQGTDQVMGQVLRYMGWLMEEHVTEKIRGMVIVGRKDQLLSYAARAVPNVQVKVFKVVIE